MTPTEIITAAKQSGNNESTTFVSDTELYTYLSMGLREASTKAKIVEVTDTSLTSVANQADYTFPSTLFEPKRVTYDGLKLRPSTLKELDKLQSAIQNQPTTGTPRFYNFFAQTLTLVPTPDTSSLQIKIWAHKTHPDVTAVSTLSAPADFHQYFVDYVSYRIFIKEGDIDRANMYLTLWNSHVESMKRSMLERKRRDNFNIVQSEDQSISNVLGLV